LRFVNIGFGNLVSIEKIVSIVSPEAAPVKRMVQVAKERSSLIDATAGRKTRAVIVTDSEHIILSAIAPETILNRLEGAAEENDSLEELL
jgi:regulator of extracellular matrix RemA (YlzA/DUF370 family)